MQESTEHVDVLHVGDHLPSFSITMNDGRTLTTEDFIGKSSVIIFFNTSCTDCQRELPILNARYLTEEPDTSTLWVCISREEGDASVQTFWKHHNISIPYSAQEDRRIYNLFAKSGIPRIFCADRKGIITQIK